MAKIRAFTEADYIAVGKRRGSGDLADDASKAQARWVRDVTSLSKYGYGQAALDRFRALRDEHEQLRTARSSSVATKLIMVRDRRARELKGKRWVDRMTAALLPLARNSPALAAQLSEAQPVDSDNLETSIGAMAELLQANLELLPAEVGAAAAIEEATSLRALLAAGPGAVATAKTETVTDTVEIDLLDGRLHVEIGDLNDAARKAIRSGDLRVPLSDYRFAPSGSSSSTSTSTSGVGGEAEEFPLI